MSKIIVQVEGDTASEIAKLLRETAGIFGKQAEAECDPTARPTKKTKKPVEEVEEEEEPEEVEEETEEEEVEEEEVEDEIDDDTILKAFNNFIKAKAKGGKGKSPDDAKKLLKKFGVAKVTKLTQAQRKSAMKVLK